MKKQYVYVVTFNLVITAIFSRRMACYNWMVDNLPPVADDQIKSYSQFARDINQEKTWTIQLYGTSQYVVARYPLCSRYKHGKLI